ncbi:AraC-like DNA-binding protein [Parabacteroides sp. PF5-5]|uniref:AraC family transcriptional regulator n=1 Tax=unclassified Parabacteroides TaxID=2649774 RepID=UPI0024743B9E|nr:MULTISPECIES: AraC family transcriptional regulator [unclassified Parabacteroides]MDH6305416.1 AraC-like DNA-binding protein [Parabacteroides sp. PH5-39]MDH6316126.1 AraC-like DNA-binding protein [Parabacteroides sp. PF5-13]MDH6320276.1 AraC-like DNA-binding protein [Parabacteroides sp. PH5-13]MDH6324006.1 AraC-like DNA-binding protein [Parabacteroides sp. PH5-8]MDH6327317.1 AraC-like DNA-binding protein [Parabacteroides sp. PH5-41]
MSQIDVLQEVTSLSPEDCFLVMQRNKQSFAYPPHVHPEFELNYLENASGAIRVVADSIEEIGDLDLLLIGGGTTHAYSNHTCKFENTVEITIQFHRSLFDSLINKRHFKTIRNMFDNAAHGLVFSKDTIHRIQPELKMLSNNDETNSFRNLLRLLDILKSLSLDTNARRLNTLNNVNNFKDQDNDRLSMIMLFLHENYQRSITLADVANLINASESSVTRFLKKWTGKTFIDNLNEIRISGSISRLIETSDTISEICYKSGFNNLSNFNRIFRKKKGVTPTEYRERYARSRFKI